MSVYNLAFRAGMPLGALVLGKLIPVLGVSTGVAGFGMALAAEAGYFLLVLSKVPTFQRNVDSRV
jgi:hypothetical protein